MGLLFEELAAKDLEWYCNVNMYATASILNSVEERFMKNWKYVFITGLGLENPLLYYLADRFINGMEYEDIASKYGVKESVVRTAVDQHLELLLSPRALTLFEEEYPLQLVKMKKHQFNGFYNNYAEWCEPEYKPSNLYLNISLFDIFDNYYFKNFAKKNGIKCIGDLCTYIDENKNDILQKKAGIGKSTASLLLTNKFVVKTISPEALETLQKISVK